MEKIVNDLLKEELYYEKMENGLVKERLIMVMKINQIKNFLKRFLE